MQFTPLSTKVEINLAKYDLILILKATWVWSEATNYEICAYP
jgi:hypothetical protein